MGLLIVPLVSSALAASLPVSTHVSSHTQSFSFNGRQFYSLSGVLAHISDYPEGEDRMAVYIDVVRQASKISDLGAAFAFGLMNAIKKDKTFAMGSWTKEHVKQLLVPLDRHVKAARIGRTRREGALKTINRCWGPDVTGFFRSRNESEKTLRQLAHDNRQHHELSRGNQIAEENHRAARHNRRFATKGWY